MENALSHLEHCVNEALVRFIEPCISGTISEVSPAYARVAGLSRFLKLGDCVTFSAEAQCRLSEVVQIDESGATIKSFDSSVAACLGERAYRSQPLQILPCRSWKGRVINALGNPIDGAGPLDRGARLSPVDSAPPPAMQRARVQHPLRTGVRVIDLFTPVCAGQRIGVFAGSGVGKSTLLSMLAGSRDFDSVVIALVGERGREVREFLED
ncbi:MAG: flagellum-specific ATP synthase FliI, partial [Methylocapsa sp.]|nr:flagellum-specific ATP synthase FliI [Methylocapsa sp.]